MSKAEKDDLAGFFLKRGKLSLVGDMTGDYERYIHKSGQESILNIFNGDSTKAKEVGEQGLVDTFLIHETIHQAQDVAKLPENFMEYGVQYYLAEAAESISVPLYYQPSDLEAMADTYKKLLAKHGDDVHKLAFGTLLDSNQRETIFRSFHEMKKEQGSSPTLPDGASDGSLQQTDPTHEHSE